MLGKRSITFLLLLSIVSSIFYLPTFTPRAHAILGISDFGWDIPTVVEDIIDKIAASLAQVLIDNMVKSTVKWAQSGFEGNPAYVTNPEQYFTDIADGVAGNYIAGTDLNFLCSPFQTQIRLALQRSYVQTPQFQCTLTEVVGNIDAFYNDFNQGGWDGWLSMTQNDLNNPYGAFFEAQIELDSRIAKAVGLKNQQLEWNQGFLSYEQCPEGMEFVGPATPPDPDNPGPNLQPGDCLVREVTVTPGTTIKSQLDKVLPSGLEKLISVQHIDQLISSFATGLLNRYVFGSRGLFASNSTGSTAPTNVNSRTGKIDLDGDTIPEGQDFDHDGLLNSTTTDVCYHGGEPPSCIVSSSATSSPYFTPICQALNQVVITLEDFTTFMDTYAYQMEGGGDLAEQIIGAILGGPVGVAFLGFLSGSNSVNDFVIDADAEIWLNRHEEVSAAVKELIGSIRDRAATYFDDLEIATNRYNNYIDKVNESLIKDENLDLAVFGNGGGGLENLMRNSAYNLRYFQEVKAEIGQCNAPEFGTIDDIPMPPEVEPLVGGTCVGVTQAGVMAILQTHAPSDAGMQQALPELRTAFGSQVSIFGNPNDAIDKINFGGGMTVDVISNAGGPNAAWSWLVVSACSSTGGGGDGVSCSTVPTAQSCVAPNQAGVVQTVKDFLIAQSVNISGPCGAFEITRRVACATGSGLLVTYHSGQCGGLAAGILGYPDNSEVDILSDEGGTNIPSWNPWPGNGDPGVYYTPAQGCPIDPSGSY